MHLTSSLDSCEPAMFGASTEDIAHPRAQLRRLRCLIVHTGILTLLELISGHHLLSSCLLLTVREHHHLQENSL